MFEASGFPALFAEIVFLKRVELERAYVALFVLLLVGHALFEVAVLLEPVFLCHRLFLLFGLDDASLLAELLHLAFEHGILAELAFQRTVVERNLDRGFQSYLFETLLAVAQNPCVVAAEGMLQPFAYHLVGAQQVGCGDAFAVGRIHHDDALLGRSGEVFEVLLADGDFLRQTGSPHVEIGGIDRLHVVVVAVDMMFEISFLRVVVVDFVEQVGIEVGPFLESKLLAENARRNVACDEGSLNGQRSRSAHRVDEVGFASPSRHENHAGSQHLVERSLARLLPVASPV